jgi:hypothetical protein
MQVIRNTEYGSTCIITVLFIYYCITCINTNTVVEESRNL